MSRRVSICVAIVLMGGIAPVNHALAQAPPPVSSVFGGGAGTRSAGHSLELDATVNGAYDDNGIPQGPVVPLFQTSGFYSSLAENLGYSWGSRRVQIGANAGTEVRYYPHQQAFVGISQYAAAGISASFARRTSVFVNQTVSRSPAYFGGMFPTLPDTAPGAITVPGSDYAASDFNSLSYDTEARVSHGVTRNGTLSFSSSVGRTAFATISGYDNLNSYSVGGRFTQRVSRNTSLRAGYIYRQGQYGYLASDGTAAIHDLDIGVDYARALALFRRTQVDFNVGSSIVGAPAGSGMGPQYRVVGNVGLNHELSRTWRARLAYTRGFGFVDGLPAPVFSDGVTGSVSGFLSRRVDISMSSSLTTGDVGMASAGTGNGSLDSFTSNAQARFALNRLWAASIDYSYYRHDIGSAVRLPFGVSSFQERSAVRVGLSLWLPLVRR